MPSTYTPNLGLEKPATGEQAGVWGVTANSSYDFLDTAIDSGVTVALSASAYTLLTNQGTPSVGRNKVITFTGALTADGTVTIAPNTAQKIYFVSNQTTGGFALNFSQGTGPTYQLLNGRSAMIFANGLGGPAGVVGVFADMQVNSLLVQTNLIVQGQVQWGSPAVFNQPVTFQGLATMQAGATISAPLILALGGDAPYDMYYRSAAGTVARLPNGAVGQVLTATAAGPSWATPAVVGIGAPITGAVPKLVFIADQTGKLAQDNSFIWDPNMGLGIGMPPVNSLTIGHNRPANIVLDAVVTGASPPGRAIFFTSNQLNRWVLSTAGDAESGANQGSTLYLQSFNDDGSGGNYTLACFRRGGRVTFGAVVDGYAAQVAIIGTQPTQTTLYVRGAPAQTAFLQLWLDPVGNIVASLDASGNFHAKSYT